MANTQRSFLYVLWIVSLCAIVNQLLVSLPLASVKNILMFSKTTNIKSDGGYRLITIVQFCIM